MGEIWKRQHGHEDFARPESGKVDEVYCGVCGAKMKVQRNVFGPTGFAEAMAKSGHLHDLFSCPHRGMDWHEQALMLRREILNTPSASIAKILSKELRTVIRRRKPTKVVASGMLV